MLLENITLGRTIEIYVDREGYRYRLTSKVEDVTQKRVCVTLIAARGKVFLFKPEDEIRIVYRDTDKMWEWSNVKAGLAKMDNVPIHVFEVLDKGRSFNRRNAYRITLSEEVSVGYYQLPKGLGRSYDEYEPVNEEDFTDIKQYQKPYFVPALVRDVSENGVGICTDFEFNIEDGIFLDIPSPYGALKAKAQIVRKSELRASSAKYHNYYGCSLVQADKRLIKFIFDVQREALKKQRFQQQEELEKRQEYQRRQEEQNEA